ncbi:MAG: hypothetical protein WC909_01435 [Candidatus Paceibacterota bacterium]|jgi:hypothetical protein
MSKEILQDIITDFKVDKFVRFFRHKNRSFRPQRETLNEYDDNDFSEGLKLGEIKFDNEANNLIICAFYSIKSLSERTGKKAQYEKAKKILKEKGFDSGIFIFYDQKGNFRFSLIYFNYLGKGRHPSSFRRFTYFVSLDFTNKTFLQRIGEGDFYSLEKIKDAFSVEKVTEDFYRDIANWYFWAIQNSRFPKDAEEEENGRSMAIIRLITRLIFIWFMRVRGLVPDSFFNKNRIDEYLNDVSPQCSSYYKAILQNLFFATLSTKRKERNFRSEIRGARGYNPDFGNQYTYRYHQLFKNSENIKDYFGEIPFLNGGIFECLDDKKNGIYIDGFSDTIKNQPIIPNFLFFSEESNTDLNKEYGTRDKKYKVRGIINTLSYYNFTIDENDPNDAEVALDPELLGKVFENLLASFNPETATTARKTTGSYYTPREIVDYMVTESLKEYFRAYFNHKEDLDEKLEILFNSENDRNPFDEQESKKIVELIDKLRIVDPAVGSGAFPMSILIKLVYILSKLDPENLFWKQAQLDVVHNIPDPKSRKDAIDNIEKNFQEKNVNYFRKLYLIQKCIYGVDIQQIAVEISKLRFFISLLVDEKIDKDNINGNWGIEPLPNLDFKIMQGDSLLSEFLGVDFDNSINDQDKKGQCVFGFKEEDDGLIRAFEQKKIDYQNETDRDKKNKLQNEIENLMVKIFETRLQRKYEGINNIIEKAKGILDLKNREEFIKRERVKFYKRQGFDLESIEKQFREFSSKKKKRPFFAWKLYFAEVFRGNNPGFDIVIANPPYGNLIELDKKDLLKKKYKYGDFSEISSLFVERGYNLLKEKGCIFYIITFAITFSKNFSQIRQLLNKNFKKTSLFTLDRDRCSTFKSMTQSVSVFKGLNKHSTINKGIFTSRFFRTFPDINQIEYSNSNNYLLPTINDFSKKHRLPKIGENNNREILDNLFKFREHLLKVINRGKNIWIRTSGNYWYNAFDRKPYNSSEVKTLKVEDMYSDLVIILMNSSLFYFWFRVYGDGRHMNRDIFEWFPLPSYIEVKKYSLLLENARRVFLERLFSVFDTKRNRFLTSNIKKDIDLLDLVLGKYLYNFSYEQIDHIMNYDHEIRGGRKINSEIAKIIDEMLLLFPSNKSQKNNENQLKIQQLDKIIDNLIYKEYRLTGDEGKSTGLDNKV